VPLPLVLDCPAKPGEVDEAAPEDWSAEEVEPRPVELELFGLELDWPDALELRPLVSGLELDCPEALEPRPAVPELELLWPDELGLEALEPLAPV